MWLQDKRELPEGSDIDLVLEGENLSINDIWKFEKELDDLLLPYLFDFSLLQQINNPPLPGHIKREGKDF